MLAEVDIAIREVLSAYDSAVQQVVMPSLPASVPSSSAPLPSQQTLPPPVTSYAFSSHPAQPVLSSAATATQFPFSGRDQWQAPQQQQNQ